MIAQKVLLSVEGLYKKFTKDLKYNMYHGVTDLTRNFFGINFKSDELRTKEFWALNDVSFNIHEGEIVALLGTNGSGKTTLIRLLAGIYNLEKGAVKYDDCVKNIISVFAIKSGFYSSLSGLENVYLKCAYYGLTKEEVDERLDFIVDFSGVAEYLHAPIGKYSSGMKTRLAMSIVLSIKGDILFIDEGFSFSDPGFKQKCFDYLKKEYLQKGKSLVIATHRLDKIKDLANRIIVLNKGKIVYDGLEVADGMMKFHNLFKQDKTH